jgi:hypothetical protein
VSSHFGPRLIALVAMALGGCAPGEILDRTRPQDGATRGDATASRDAGTLDARSITDGSALDAVMLADASIADGSVVVDAGPGCVPACGANAYCAAGACRCAPGFERDGDQCIASASGTDPTTHSEAEVCRRWREGHQSTARASFVAGPTMCDPGSMPREAIDDTLVRINMFRWMVGLGPVSDSDAMNRAGQACAVLEERAGWPGPSNPDPHHPPPTAPCYSAEGASAAGSSNISWGTSSAADAIDNFMTDNGNESTLGHRRWIMNPPLGPVGVGFYQSAMCLGVFGMSGGGRALPFHAYPPPGVAPLDIANGYWSFTGHEVSSTASTTITMTRQPDGMSATIRRLSLLGNFGGGDALGWRVTAPTIRAGETWRVTLSNMRTSMGERAVEYDVRVAQCP